MDHASLTTEVSSWRSRHYARRAAWIRDMIVHESVLVKYQSGKNIIADGLTKGASEGKAQGSQRQIAVAR
eukprot:4140029-Prorocentrum_lima.AAC.1